MIGLTLAGSLNDAPSAVRHMTEPELGRVATTYERRVRALCDGEYPDAVALRGRLAPERWALEWNLVSWLGSAFGVERATVFELTLSNVLGLASIRLRDDIVDGDLRGYSYEEVAAALYAAALDPYRSRFASDSLLWPQLELRMGEWRAATLADGQMHHELAKRGAPLKVPAFAICLLAGRLGQFRVVESALDHALTGMVLYDHYVDWREDLAAGRWNAFVERTGKGATEREVLVSMLTTRSVTEHFELIARELEMAEDRAASIGVIGLARHLGTRRDELDSEGRAMATRYHQLAERGRSLLFHDDQAWAT
jgi:hypothetical protein